MFEQLQKLLMNGKRVNVHFANGDTYYISEILKIDGDYVTAKFSATFENLVFTKTEISHLTFISK